MCIINLRFLAFRDFRGYVIPVAVSMCSLSLKNSLRTYEKNRKENHNRVVSLCDKNTLTFLV